MSDTLPFRAQINQTLVEVWLGNIVDANTDAIVNAANTSLLGGGGVDGAIHRAAGPDLVAECRKYHGCKVGQAKITRGYNHKAAYVIHAVGPVYGVANDSDLLASAYQSSFNLTMQHPIKTIAFPAISTGAYQYPLDEAAEIALTVTYNFVREKTHLEKVLFILFTQTALTAFARALKTLIDENTDIQRLD